MLLFAALACAAPTAPTAPAEPIAAPPGLVDRTWRVTASDAVARGTRYTFRSDGTLVVRRGGDPPGVGQ